MNLIREGRFGKPKTYKTGAVCDTYPGPLFVWQFDSGGLDVCKRKVVYIEPPVVTPKGVTWPSLLTVLGKKTEELDANTIYAIDFAKMFNSELDEIYAPICDDSPYRYFVMSVNQIRKQCPFKTVVLDNATGLSEALYSHTAKTNNKKLEDARKWAGGIGLMVAKVIQTICTIQCNFVCLFHEDTDVTEETKVIQTVPMVYSKLRFIVGKSFSQWFHSRKKNGIPVLDTVDHEYAEGLGARWPANLPDEVGPLYKDIYETAYPPKKGML